MSYSYPLFLKQNCTCFVYPVLVRMCIQIIRLSDEWKTYNWVTFSHNIGFLLHQNISQPQKDFLFLHSWILSEIINTSIRQLCVLLFSILVRIDFWGWKNPFPPRFTRFLGISGPRAHQYYFSSLREK